MSVANVHWQTATRNNDYKSKHPNYKDFFDFALYTYLFQVIVYMHNTCWCQLEWFTALQAYKLLIDSTVSANVVKAIKLYLCYLTAEIKPIRAEYRDKRKTLLKKIRAITIKYILLKQGIFALT